jgi:hypothetical protein
MATAVLVAAILRDTLPSDLRISDAQWLLGLFCVVMLGTLIIGDPGRIDRQKAWLRVLTDVLIAVITIVNASAAVRLVTGIIDTDSFTNNAKTLRGGAAARAHGRGKPAFVFPR